MEAKKIFNDELFCSLRVKAEQQELEQLYLESGCNEDVYYLIISHMLLKKYNCKEQINLIKKFIQSDFDENLYMFLKSDAVNGKYDI